jgi:hypothetical protein
LFQLGESLLNQPTAHRVLSVGRVQEHRTTSQRFGIFCGQQLGQFLAATEGHRTGRHRGGRQGAGLRIGHGPGTQRIVITAPRRPALGLGGPRRKHHGKSRTGQHVMKRIHQRSVWEIVIGTRIAPYDDQRNASGPRSGDG